MKLGYLNIVFAIILFSGSCQIPSQEFSIQKFEFGNHSIKIIGSKESDRKYLEVNGLKAHEYILEKFPAQVTDVSNDSIYITYYIFSNKVADTIKYENLERHFVLTKRYEIITSTIRGPEHAIDSVAVKNRICILYSNGETVDSTSQNELQFNGKSFFKRYFDSAEHSTIFKTFFISDKRFVDSYTN